ncbi:hypothetical protein BDZ89DRAFT_100195 [Hymenopellis radicata]|nr:hypothetical protein BDZ89DRAFT_100195 [Hymenopellis radicata]
MGSTQQHDEPHLTLRIRSGRFWLDDAWVIVALICSILLLVDMWIRTDVSQARTTRINAYWMVSLNFTNTLWASRMSIIFAVIRLIPTQMRLRQITNFFAVLFGLMWIGLLIQKVYVCASDKYWYYLPKPQCHLGHGVAAMELTTDGVADLALAAIPIYLLRDITLVKSHRKMLILIFSSSLLVTLTSIVHAVYLLGPTGLLEAITAQAEAAVALMVANMGVVVMALYRVLRKDRDFDPAPYTYNFETTTNGGVRLQRVLNPARTENDTIEFAAIVGDTHLSGTTDSEISTKDKPPIEVALHSEPLVDEIHVKEV